MRVIGPVVREQLYDDPLLLARGDASTAATPRVENGQAERGRPAAVSPPRIRAVVEENANRLRATSANCAMQRRYAALVGRIRIGTGTDEIRNDLRLRSRIPPFRSRLADACIVKRLCSPAIPRADVGAEADELLGDVRSVRRRGDVERRVAGVHVAPDLREEVVRRPPASCADCRCTQGESRGIGEQAQGVWLVADRDGTE